MHKLIQLGASLAFSILMPLASHAAESSPFKATLQTKESLAFNPTACVSVPFLQGTTTGAGVAAHLGKVTGTATDCIIPGDSVYTFTGGHLVLTAANGDTLTADYSGSLTPTTAPAVFTLAGSYRITGGTGRFAGATGTGYMQGVNNIVSGAGAYTLNGEIAY